ncbi:FCS-Like Zinc finger 15-like [Salvia hispanica]|uniref:FCS-Like Zinc finger 15-like n=1 Tax=Salvia hispanica TaxID=49212 RepID=UPI002009C186|nr:FCS-Like Zinc finger 15-like [Salvia hispanica]
MVKQIDSYKKRVRGSYKALHHLFSKSPISFRHHSSAAREHEMVGLSVILETYRDRSPQILSKAAMNMIIKPNSSGFLDNCFLCRRKLLPGNDTFMYKGDRAFCSVECRCRQIFMDEEESACTLEYTCSAAATSSRSGKGGRAPFAF